MAENFVQMRLAVRFVCVVSTFPNGGEISGHSGIPWQPGCWATTLADQCWGADAPAPLIGAMARGGLEAARAGEGGGAGGGGCGRVFSV